MCGIIVSTLDVEEDAYKYVKNRGPDKTNKIKYNGVNFIHFLLHLTGEITSQPIIDEKIVCIFNGEIYNYKEIMHDAKSDGYSIIHAYKKFGEDFAKYLDGEFVIIIFDYEKNKIMIASDIFKTKPLFYKIENDIIIASYESACKKIKDQEYDSINNNELLVFDITTKKLIKKEKIHEFDLNQKKDNYDDYIKSFEKAVLKRYPEHSIPLISLSSGLDSGAIACCLNKYKKEALYISINKNEDVNTLTNRQKILKNHMLIELSIKEKKEWKEDLEKKCEKFEWDWRYNYKVNKIHNGFEMGSMLGKSKIISEAKKIDSKIRVLYSGIGADEIMARNQYYSCGYGNVDEFPKELEEIYPWPNFYEGSMKNYLKGDEYVGGCYSYETRYPFCDKELVQEFLWLTPELKNVYNKSIYKPALLYYLKENNFPIYMKKLGFDV